MKRIVLITLLVSLLLASTACGAPKPEAETFEPDAGYAGNYCVVQASDTIDYRDLEPVTLSSDMTKLSTAQAEYTLTWVADTLATFDSDKSEVSLDTGVNGNRTIFIDFTNGESIHLCQGERIEITAENWAEYFYISPVKELTINSFGEVDRISIGLGIILKDEYAAKVSYESADALAFEINYSFTYHALRYDKQGNVTIGKKIDQKDRKTTVCDLNYISYDARQIRLELLEEAVVINNTIAGRTSGSSLLTVDGTGYSVPEDYKIKRVTGSIILFK